MRKLIETKRFMLFDGASDAYMFTFGIACRRTDDNGIDIRLLAFRYQLGFSVRGKSPRDVGVTK